MRTDTGHARAWCRATSLLGTLAALALVAAEPLPAQQWYATLSGAAEALPNASPGFGTFQFTLVADVLRVQVCSGGCRRTRPVHTSTAARLRPAPVRPVW